MRRRVRTMVSVRMTLRHSSALSSRAGRSLGRRRPASVPRRLRPEYQALCHSERSEESFSLANQRPRTDYAEQGGERQTKCSQTSVSSAYRFFVALLLRMTNCEFRVDARQEYFEWFVPSKSRIKPPQGIDSECTIQNSQLIPCMWA